jgi:hypothetical protein
MPQSSKSHLDVDVIVFVVLGIATLVSAPTNKPPLLGYYAHCPFTPISTIICWIVAGVIYWFGRKRR